MSKYYLFHSGPNTHNASISSAQPWKSCFINVLPSQTLKRSEQPGWDGRSGHRLSSGTVLSEAPGEVPSGGPHRGGQACHMCHRPLSTRPQTRSSPAESDSVCSLCAVGTESHRRQRAEGRAQEKGADFCFMIPALRERKI